MSAPTVLASVEEPLYRNLFEVAGDSIIVCFEDGLAIECNQAALDLFACTREQMLGTSPIDWSPEVQPNGRPSSEMAAEIFARVKAAGMARFEWQNQRADGSPLPVDVTVRHAQTGGHDLFVVISRDITERRKTENILKASEAKYRALVETTGTGYLIVDTEGRVIDANPAYVRLSGHAVLEDILGRSVLEWTAGDQRQKNALAVAQCARDGFVKDIVIDYVDGDGRIKPIEINATVVVDGDSRRIIALCRDITERKQAEDTLRQERELYADLINTQAAGIYRVRIFNPKNWRADAWLSSASAPYSMDLVSERFCKILGVSKEAFERNPGILIDLVHPEDRAGFAQVHDVAMASPKRFFWEGRILNNGEIRWVDFESTPRPLQDGDVIWTGAVSDVTERKRAELALVGARNAADAANLTKTRFLAAASHDLRQPTMAIALFTDALEKTGLSKEQKKIHDFLALSTKSLGDILNSLLDISRLDSGEVVADFQALEAESLLARIDTEYGPLAQMKSLRFKLYFPLGGLHVRADAKLLQILLGNLLGNAIKYTDEGGVLVGVRRRGKRALVQVWDTGIGIAAEHIGGVFDEYVQVGNPERDKAKGLGLGLAIVNRVAKLLDTEVVCRSRLGKGSVFEFTLDVVAEPPAARRRVAALVDRSQALSGLRVYIIEDDRVLATAIALALETVGMRTSIWNSAEEFLANTADAVADFYIADLRLPGSDGTQLLDAIERRTARSIRAVILTGDTSPEGIQVAQKSRWRILFKPLDIDELLSALVL